MNDRPYCDAYRSAGNQMICAPCSLNWDRDDPNPPICLRAARRMKEVRELPPLKDAPFASGLSKR